MMLKIDLLSTVRVLLTNSSIKISNSYASKRAFSQSILVTPIHFFSMNVVYVVSFSLINVPTLLILFQKNCRLLFFQSVSKPESCDSKISTATIERKFIDKLHRNEN